MGRNIASPAGGRAAIAKKTGGRGERSPPNLDAFYAEFEDSFRGTRAEIKARMSEYLADVEACGAGLPDSPILDLGCGRGEWLELLRDNSRIARGVDINAEFVRACIDLGLEVERVSAVTGLRQLASGSVGAVTSMHLVEHLDFVELVELIDECNRVLRPGGVLILETPNPENLTVAAVNFYLDPTHRNPLPPPLLHHLVAARGFAGTEVRRLTRLRNVDVPARIDEDGPHAASVNFLLAQFSAAPDYAVVARKP
jgi:O-antigen chain-terminating methyltransferase